MRTTMRPPAALILITAVLLAGCGSAAPTTTSTDHAATVARKGVTFSACMRRHGVSGFPDPGPSGRLTIDAVANGSAIDTSSPTFTRALGACKMLEPAGFTGRKRTTQQQSAALAFARCIRRHGVADFPDPLPGEPLVDTNRIPSTATSSGMSSLNAAMQQCSSAAASAGVTR